MLSDSKANRRLGQGGQDAQRDRHRPKLEVFDGYLFLVLRDLITAYEDSDPKLSHRLDEVTRVLTIATVVIGLIVFKRRGWL